MSSFTSRPYAGAADLDLLIAFAREATTARWPGLAYLHPGDVAWQLFAVTEAEGRRNIRLWFDAGGLAAFALFEPPLHAQFDVRAGVDLHAPVTAQLLSWAQERRREVARAGGEETPRAYAMLGNETLSTVALDSDHERIAFLRANGFERTERHSVRYSRDLAAPIAKRELPPGMRLRHATGADLAERSALHRDAWSTWGPSSFTEEEYRLLRALPVYDDELDVVAEAPGGALVSYCICWADEATGVSAFEPVGTRPGHTGQGLARAVILEGLRRLRDRGMHTALVSTASVNEAAMRLYPSCGFDVVEREHFYVKQVL
ncbi:MAG: GNAT family N-acetyltransferase [Tepidiformaceae bacterium]